MSLADNTAIPSPPTTYAVYRGFYVLPGDIPLPSGCVRVDFFVARSTDNLTWENWGLLGSGDASVGFYAVHTGLDENTYYAYYVQYVFRDGSKSAIGQTATPGQAELIITPSLNIDQLASQAYSTGLVTSGTFRGVVFETSATDPKVRMDPSGIFATNAFKPATPTFYLNAYDGSLTLTGPIVSGGSINIGNGKFVVDTAGNMTALSATVDGVIAASGTFSGNLSAATGTFSGTVSASTISASTITGSTISGGTITGTTITGTTVIEAPEIVLLEALTIIGGPSAQVITWTSDGTPTGTLGSGIWGDKDLTHNLNAFAGGSSVTILTSIGTSSFLQTSKNLSELSSTGTGNIVRLSGPTFTGFVTIPGLIVTSSAGFFGSGPVGQQSTTNPGGFFIGTGATVQAGFSSTGFTGSTSYTFNGVVAALKNYGLLAA